MADAKITALSAIGSVDAATDVIPVVDVSDNQTKKATRNSFLNLSSAPLGTTDTQSPTNKTFDNSNIFTIRDDRLTLQDNSDTTKQAVFQLSSITTGTTRTYTLPNVTDTLVSLTATQTLTNKTLTSPTINTATIVNPTLTVDSIAEYTAAAGVTIDGVQLKDGQVATSGAVIAASIAASAVTPEKLLSGAGTGWAWASYSPTWTNLTLGNGTISSRYTQIGKTIIYQVNLLFGSTTSISGNVAVTVPVTMSNNYSTGTATPFGSAQFIDTGTATYAGHVRYNSTTVVDLLVTGVGGTYASDTSLSSTVPFTWTNGDRLAFQMVYEAA